MTPLLEEIKILDDYMILLIFKNGEKKIYDMKKNLAYPAFENLKDINVFKKAKVVGETIEWETGEDISSEDLYYNSMKII